MTFTLTEEQVELASAVTEFFEKRSPETEVRRLMEEGGAADPAVWSQMTGQLGLAGLIVPEQYGGGGFGFRDFALVAERAGAALLVAPLLSTVSAAAALTLSANEELKSAHLPGLASGEPWARWLWLRSPAVGIRRQCRRRLRPDRTARPGSPARRCTSLTANSLICSSCRPGQRTALWACTSSTQRHRRLR